MEHLQFIWEICFEMPENSQCYKDFFHTVKMCIFFLKKIASVKCPSLSLSNDMNIFLISVLVVLIGWFKKSQKLFLLSHKCSEIMFAKKTAKQIFLHFKVFMIMFLIDSSSNYAPNSSKIIMWLSVKFFMISGIFQWLSACLLSEIFEMLTGTHTQT